VAPRAFGRGQPAHPVVPFGHVTTGFAFAITALLEWPAVGVAAVAVASVVAWSRVYARQHFILDVAVGAVLGGAVAFGVRRASGRLVQRSGGQDTPTEMFKIASRSPQPASLPIDETGTTGTATEPAPQPAKPALDGQNTAQTT